MWSRGIVAIVLFALGGCAALQDGRRPDRTWPRTGGAIDLQVRSEVIDLYARYALFADAPAGEAYASLFVENGEIVMGLLRITGREALVRRINGKERQTIHLQGYPVLVQLAPDRIVARTPVILGNQDRSATPPQGASQPASFSFSFYEDELVRTARGWKFQRRTAHPAPMPSTEFLSGLGSTAGD